MEIRQPLTIDLARPMPLVPVSAVQGDGSTRILSVTLLENGAPWQIPAEAAVDVAFRKPDGTKGIYSKLPDGSSATSRNGNVLSATLAPQMLTCPGAVLATVVFRVDSGKTLAAFPFTVTVEASPAAGAEISEDYFNPKDLSSLRAEIAAVGAYAKQVGNPHNFLDNSDFRNPVNQRGKTVYTGFTYTIDRWLISGNAGEENTFWISVDGYIGLSGGNTTENVWLVQKVLPNMIPTGEKATFAVKQNGGDILILNIDKWGTDKGITFENGVTLLYQAGEMIILNGTGSPIGIVWAALYEGEYTAETLPEYQPKGYAVEYAECQRYYQHINVICGEVLGTVNMAAYNFPAMRVIPTADTSGLTGGGELDYFAVLSNQHAEIKMSSGWLAGFVSLSADL